MDDKEDWMFEKLRAWQIALIVALLLMSIAGLIWFVPAGPPL